VNRAHDETPDLGNPGDEQLRAILSGLRRVAVVGISERPDRPSHGIARFLAGLGVEVLGVNPTLREALGRPVYASLAEVPGEIDLVDVFRRPEAVPPVMAEAIARRAPVVWLQEGIVHAEAAAQGRAAGLVVVQDRCLYKEWLRLLNG